MVVNQMLPIVSVSLALSALTYLLTPSVGKKLRKMKIVGVDVHKARRPRIPEMGGIVILIPLLFLLLATYALTGMQALLFVSASTLFFGTYGILDDLMQLGKYKKLALSTGIGSVLLIPLSPVMIAVPLLLVFTVGLGNIFNIFAGFNGLEMGCGASVSFFFSTLCLITGNIVPFYLSLGVFLMLLAFLLHNKYPAKIFPGNVGTFTIGGFFAGICLYYGLYYLIIPLLALHLADIALKGVSAGFFSSSEKKKTKVNGEDILVPRNDYLSLVRLVLKLKPMNEKQLVNFFWALSILTGVTTVAVTGALV
jgi:UDP-N-acetylglucosamine--dolichyl-phosphate N-acetylglucosaminephosphotransferase